MVASPSPGRRIGQRRDATRALIQGHRTEVPYGFRALMQLGHSFDVIQGCVM